jgi:hypothetical protein
LDKQKLQDFLNDQALSIPDIQDPVPYVSGTVRGKKWVPPPMPKDNIGKLISQLKKKIILKLINEKVPSRVSILSAMKKRRKNS